MSIRPIKQLTQAAPVIEGAGVHLHRAFGFGKTEDFDPFLLLDDFRNDNPDHYRAGFPWHPHRGIETITYILSGTVEHGDSLGNQGSLGAGDIQWMTAGRGLVHEEFHSQKFAKAGGAFEMCQLWLNLPKEHKMTPPRYQPILKNEITTSPLYLHAADACGAPADPAEGGVRVIAGSFMGVKGPASTFTQVRVCV